MKIAFSIAFMVIAGFLLSSSSFAQNPDYLPTEGLIAWYPFEDNALDLSGNGHDAELKYDAVLSEDRFGLPGRAVFLDGSDDHVLTPAIFNSGSDRTISIWLELADVSDVTNTIWNTVPHWIESVGWNTYFLSEPGISYCLGDAINWTSCGPTFFDVSADDMEGWKHLVSSKEGLEWRFYLDGQLIHDSTLTFNTLDQSVPLMFGAISCCGGEEFTGAIDDIGIWNRALTEEEILSLYNAESPVPGCTDPSACNFDSEATSDNGSCIPSGCMDSEACNYNPLAECEGESCDYTCCPGPGCCLEGTVWDAELGGCIPLDTSCPHDLDFDGVVGVNDLMELLSAFGTDCLEPEGPATSEFTCGDPVSYHGYDYETVQIGEQCWFAENARFLPEVSPSALGSEVDGLPHAYVYGYDGSVVSEAVQSSGYANGALYNFDAVISWEICPAGWYVPSDEDWMTLESFLGMDENELEWFYPEQGFERGADEEIGFKLKSVEWDGGNSTGFSALSNGWRWAGVFAYPEYTNFWTSTQISPEVSWARILREGESGIARQPYYPHFGKSVRCVQESE